MSRLHWKWTNSTNTQTRNYTVFKVLDYFQHYSSSINTMPNDQQPFSPWHCTSKWTVQEEDSKDDTNGETQWAEWNAFPLYTYGCPYDNRAGNSTCWTNDELEMLSNNYDETIHVFRILQQHFCHDDHNVVTFEDAARNVEDTRGNLCSIQKSLTYVTTLQGGFTPAQFLALSFILVEDVGYAKLLMFLLQKRPRLPWTMKLSTKPFPLWSVDLNKKYLPKPYNILQLQKQMKHNITEVNQQHVTAESQVAQWNAFPLDVYGLP